MRRGTAEGGTAERPTVSGRARCVGKGHAGRRPSRAARGSRRVCVQGDGPSRSSWDGVSAVAEAGTASRARADESLSKRRV